ncbi:Cyclin N-terminal domain-containing protein [Mycena sanguinolenta]|uniref:Cyclin N-terminal domain-containing protein n=1 Tax=Mycena sanguinolenta TaxID=230812 RepID=A0A8H6YUY2_9AGAR|nr:Cyclin N-terminal domain-containing protein [Mycena sanguinolenta]
MNSPATSDSSSSSSGSYSSWSPSSKSSSSPVHPASLVDPSTHSPELMELVAVPISRPLIKYVVDCVSETVNIAFGRPSKFQWAHARKFKQFVSDILLRAEVETRTLLVALVYISRSKHHLSIALEQWALERVFLGALILASKFTQDSTLRNVHWALVTGVFGKGDIGRIEREFLDVLDWELSVKEKDLMAHYNGLVAAFSGSPAPLVSRPAVEVAPLPTAPISVPLPELEPSSPQSSTGTLSPRTPVSPSSPTLDMHMQVDTCSPVSPSNAVSAHSPLSFPASTPARAPVPIPTQQTLPPPPPAAPKKRCGRPRTYARPRTPQTPQPSPPRVPLSPPPRAVRRGGRGVVPDLASLRRRRTNTSPYTYAYAYMRIFTRYTYTHVPSHARNCMLDTSVAMQSLSRAEAALAADWCCGCATDNSCTCSLLTHSNFISNIFSPWDIR